VAPVSGQLTPADEVKLPQMALALLLRALPRAPAMVARRTFHYAPLGLMAIQLFSLKRSPLPHSTDIFACL
jgi:hypothetical protein